MGLTYLSPPQLQALLGEGHVNIVTAKEVALTAKHVCLIMEFAAGGNMTAYVAKKSQSAAAGAEGQLFMTEDEARYFYRVRCSRPYTSFQSHERELARFAALAR